MCSSIRTCAYEELAATGIRHGPLFAKSLAPNGQLPRSLLIQTALALLAREAKREASTMFSDGGFNPVAGVMMSVIFAVYVPTCAPKVAPTAPLSGALMAELW